MSGADRERWDERYRLGAYVEREHPSAWLVSCLSRAPSGRALDVACGAGRNALYLAERGYAVTGIDVSPVALARAAESAAARVSRSIGASGTSTTAPALRDPSTSSS